MGMNDRSLNATIDAIFIALTLIVIQQCLLAWQTGDFRVLPDLRSGGGAQRKCDTRNINHTVNNACTDGFCPLNADFILSHQRFNAKR